MRNYHAVTTAACHGLRALKLTTLPIAAPAPGALRLLFGFASALTCNGSSQTTSASPAVPSTRLPLEAKRMGSISSTTGSLNTRGNHSYAAIATAASLALATSYAFSPTSASRESNQIDANDNKQSSTGLADESEEGNGENGTVQDGMDARSETAKTSSPLDSSSRGPAEAEEEDDDDDDEDDPSKDEETTCSICLINRQGPCRKYWLKFEGCMKEHSAEKEKAEDKAKASEKKSESEDTAEGKKEEVGDEADGDEEEQSSTNDDRTSKDEEEMSLAQRCDKFMIPWIGCIQEHRNIYSLISNAFYQKDFIDPLEESVLESKRMFFAKNNDEIGEVKGYVMKFHGVEIDLGNWREYVEADADVDNGSETLFEDAEDGATTVTTPATAISGMEEPHLINAYAKFRLVDPSSGRPIEVAYVKDQKGRLLGFDSFTKRGNNGADSNGEDVGLKDQDGDQEKTPADGTISKDGECTFHIVPGETTSITAYAIYRGARKQDKEGASTREDFLYYTPVVPLPGVRT